MRERSEQLLRILCLVLGALLVAQLALRVIRHDPLANLKIPPLPTLTNAPETQLPGKPTNAAALLKGPYAGTNTLTAKGSTNKAAISIAATNSQTTIVVTHELAGKATNIASGARFEASSGHEPAGVSNRTEIAAVTATNLSARARMRTSGFPSSNALPHSGSQTSLVAVAKGGTNLINQSERVGSGTNLLARSGPPGMMPPGGFGGQPMKAKPLPAPIQARVDRVIDSELLGPVMRPLPVALLGIAGDVAFLRTANGQTGLVKEGDKLGDLKLLRIGVNRVLVEEDGQKKELMVFNGYGGESLLPKTQDNSQ